jgi:hypothetical protein
MDVGLVIELLQPSKMGKSPPKRVPNGERRSREYLTPAEIEDMIAVVKAAGRHGHRNATIIPLAYRHASRSRYQSLDLEVPVVPRRHEEGSCTKILVDQSRGPVIGLMTYSCRFFIVHFEGICNDGGKECSSRSHDGR